jgi:hypothetical protein
LEPDRESLSPERFQLFLAGLAGLPAEEIRKAKLLYLRNAISEYKASLAGARGFEGATGCMGANPLFWPMLRAQRSMLGSQLSFREERIRNALRVWQDDLGGERAELEKMLDDLKPH